MVWKILLALLLFVFIAIAGFIVVLKVRWDAAHPRPVLTSEMESYIISLDEELVQLRTKWIGGEFEGFNIDITKQITDLYPTTLSAREFILALERDQYRANGGASDRQEILDQTISGLWSFNYRAYVSHLFPKRDFPVSIIIRVGGVGQELTPEDIRAFASIATK